MTNKGFTDDKRTLFKCKVTSIALLQCRVSPPCGIGSVEQLYLPRRMKTLPSDVVVSTNKQLFDSNTMGTLMTKPRYSTKEVLAEVGMMTCERACSRENKPWLDPQQTHPDTGRMSCCRIQTDTHTQQ